MQKFKHFQVELKFMKRPGLKMILLSKTELGGKIMWASLPMTYIIFDNEMNIIPQSTSCELVNLDWELVQEYHLTVTKEPHNEFLNFDQYDLILLIEKSLEYRLLYIDLKFNDRNFPVIAEFDNMSTKMYGDYQTEYTKNTMKGNWCKIEELYLTLC